MDTGYFLELLSGGPAPEHPHATFAAEIAKEAKGLLMSFKGSDGKPHGPFPHQKMLVSIDEAQTLRHSLLEAVTFIRESIRSALSEHDSSSGPMLFGSMLVEATGDHELDSRNAVFGHRVEDLLWEVTELLIDGGSIKESENAKQIIAAIFAIHEASQSMASHGAQSVLHLLRAERLCGEARKQRTIRVFRNSTAALGEQIVSDKAQKAANKKHETTNTLKAYALELYLKKAPDNIALKKTAAEIADAVAKHADSELNLKEYKNYEVVYGEGLHDMIYRHISKHIKKTTM